MNSTTFASHFPTYQNHVTKMESPYSDPPNGPEPFTLLTSICDSQNKKAITQHLFDCNTTEKMRVALPGFIWTPKAQTLNEGAVYRSCSAPSSAKLTCNPGLTEVTTQYSLEVVDALRDAGVKMNFSKENAIVLYNTPPDSSGRTYRVMPMHYVNCKELTTIREVVKAGNEFLKTVFPLKGT